MKLCQAQEHTLWLALSRAHLTRMFVLGGHAQAMIPTQSSIYICGTTWVNINYYRSLIVTHYVVELAPCICVIAIMIEVLVCIIYIPGMHAIIHLPAKSPALGIICNIIT